MQRSTDGTPAELLRRAETLTRLIHGHRESGASLSLLTTILDEPAGYGHIVRDPSGRLARIVEHKDASEAERSLREINRDLHPRDEFEIGW